MRQVRLVLQVEIARSFFCSNGVSESAQRFADQFGPLVLALDSQICDLQSKQDFLLWYKRNVRLFAAFCNGRAPGAYPHPLHCWQFVACGFSFGGDSEMTCYAGRSFTTVGYPQCKKDESCIWGAPSKGTIAWAAAMTKSGKARILRFTLREQFFLARK